MKEFWHTFDILRYCCQNYEPEWFGRACIPMVMIITVRVVQLTLLMGSLHPLPVAPEGLT